MPSPIRIQDVRARLYIALAIGVQAPFFWLLLTEASMNDIGVFRAVALEGFAGFPFAHVGLETAMQPRIGIVERFRVARRNGRLRHQVARNLFGQEPVTGGHGATPVDPIRLIGQSNRHRFRRFLAPAQAAFGAGDLNPQVILVTDGNLRGAHQRFAPIAQLAVNREMIIQRPALNEGLEMSGNLRHIKPGYIAELHQRVRADVAAAAGTARQFRVGAPGGLHLAGGLEFGCQPPLQIIGIDPTHVPNQSGLHDVPGEPCRPMSEISMRHAKGHFVLADRLHNVVGLFEVQTQRFLTENGDPGLDGLHGGVVMHVVGRYDHQVIELLVLWQTGISRDHLIVRPISFDRIRPVSRLFQGDFRVRKQRGRDHAASPIKMDRLLMRLYNERAFPAAYQTDIEGSFGHIGGFSCI